MEASGRDEAPRIATLVCADWSSRPNKRAVWVAHVQARTVQRLAGGDWTLAKLMQVAAALPGPRLVAIDAGLGVPRAYLDGARPALGLADDAGFLAWLAAAAKQGALSGESPDASAWSPRRPFFGVPAGAGGLTRFLRAAGCDLRREVDRRTGAKTVFAVNGIPGTVGGGTRDLWRELAVMLDPKPTFPITVRPFALWPFEGELAPLLREHGTVLAEIYPRAAYATALSETLPAPARALAKTRREVRRQETAALWSAPWVEAQGVRLQDRAAAEASEDDFDAMITTAALLRCLVEKQPLYDAQLVDPAVEGGILCTGTLVRLR